MGTITSLRDSSRRAGCITKGARPVRRGARGNLPTQVGTSATRPPYPRARYWASRFGPHCGVASCQARRVQNAPSKITEGVRITYPVDPLVGLTLPVWRKTHVRGGPAFIVDVPGSHRRVIPIEWTDRRPSVPCPRVKGRPVLFDARRLVELTALLENLRSRVGGSESAAAETTSNTTTARDPRRASDRGRAHRRSDRGSRTTRRLAAMDGGGRSPRASRRRQ